MNVEARRLARKGIYAALTAYIALVTLHTPPTFADEGVTKTWAMAEFGEPPMKDGFDHWPYANPNAPKGGKIVIGAFGTFDTLNPVILKGRWPAAINLASADLMVKSGDDLLSTYGLIAESVEYPEDKSWIIFNLRPEARYSDGVPITAHDVKYAFDSYREHGRPFLKAFIEDIDGAEVLSDHRIRFTMRTRDSMKPLMIAGQIFSPLPRHFWEEKGIDKTTLEPPPASGPYQITEVDPGRSLTFTRVRNYWAADLPVNRGLYNFDEIRFEFYHDETVRFEAFKAGDSDFFGERSAKRWSTGYDFDAVADGRVQRMTARDYTPRGLGAYFFNQRKPKFADRRVRRAITNFYDFEAIQRTLLYGQYQRVKSYFPNSDYGASGLPSPEELAILEPYRNQLPEEVFTLAYEPSKTDGSGRIRRQQRQALALLKEAGWELRDGKVVNVETGEPLSLEIITASPETERVTLPFINNMKRAGIDATLRLLDIPQWRVRINENDFDLYSARNNFFPPPGTELRSYYGSAAADVRGSANSMGYKNPVADTLIEQIVSAKDLATLKATTRALDRVLLWNDNVVPQFFPDEAWLAYWDKFGFPERPPRYDITPEINAPDFTFGFPRSWWIDDAKLAKLRQK